LWDQRMNCGGILVSLTFTSVICVEQFIPDWLEAQRFCPSMGSIGFIDDCWWLNDWDVIWNRNLFRFDLTETMLNVLRNKEWEWNSITSHDLFFVGLHEWICVNFLKSSRSCFLMMT
jgi:hypothetical protein